MSTRTLLSTALLLLAATCGLLGASLAERPKIPPHFEPNRGQASSEVSFVSHGEGFGVSIEPTRVAVRLKSANSDPSTISWRLVGASETATLKGLARLPGVSSYFKGSEPKSWVRGVPHYAVIRSAEVYTGIDLVYRGSAQQALEYDFIVAPGADQGEITLEFDGTEDSIYHPFDLDGRRHMEYVTLRGEFVDVPIEEITDDMQRLYPGMIETITAGDFDSEVSKEIAAT